MGEIKVFHTQVRYFFNFIVLRGLFIHFIILLALLILDEEPEREKTRDFFKNRCKCPAHVALSLLSKTMILGRK